MNDRQVARFRIATKMIHNNPGEVAEMLAAIKAVPVRAEMLFHKGCVEYVAISDRFAEVGYGEKTPLVKLCVIRFGDEKVVEVLPEDFFD